MKAWALGLRALAFLLIAGGCKTAPSPEPPDAAAMLPPPSLVDPCAPAPPLNKDDGNCPVQVTYLPPRAVQSVAVAGEWNGFSATAQPLSGPDGAGNYTIALRLPPGTHAYKLVLDGTDWRLDSTQNYRKYVGGIENSGLRVADCHRPALRLVSGSLRIARPAALPGSFHARLEVVSAVGRPPGLCHLKSSLRIPAVQSADEPASRPLKDDELALSEDRSAIEIKLNALADGKYTIRLAASAFAQDSEPLLLPFWIEPETFSFADTPLYMGVTDRFYDGDSSNNQPLSQVLAAANYQGGDLWGVARKIDEGYFDRLHLRALWLTPFNTQPDASYVDQSGTYQVAPYHGYWPVRARSINARLGGEKALHHLVQSAHRHGIRVLMDAVLNHVHEQHEYFQNSARRDWFRQGCICGTAGCDFTEQRLTCLFASYLPDINWTVEAASEQFIADTLWWLEEFDLDGLRIDAVKHVEDLAIFNLSARVRERFEQAGTHYYLLGETAMGWNDGSIADNRENYDTIKRYMGPGGLDGQFDFVLYHSIAYRVFAYDERRFVHADYWTQASLQQFAGSLMVNYLSSHDTSRFVTLSTYRQASGPWRRDIASNKWQDLPVAPIDSEPYDRLWLGMLSIMTLPGMPLLYYGDEYGEFGGGDPDNRHFMRFDTALFGRETAQMQRMAALLAARAGWRGLRRGPMLPVLLDEDFYAYARLDTNGDPRQGALVVLNRLPTAVQSMVPLPPELGFAAGATLRDVLSDVRYQISGPRLFVGVPPRSGAILVLDDAAPARQP